MKLLNELTISDLKHNKKRTIMTITGISLSVALIFTIIAMAFSLKDAMRSLILSSNGSYHFSLYDSKDYEGKIKNNRNVSKDFNINYLLGYSRNGSSYEYMPYYKLMATDKDGFSKNNLKLIDGRFPENTNEIVVSKAAIELGKIKISLGQNLVFNLGDRYFDSKPLFNSSYDDQETLIIKDKKTFKIVGIIDRPSDIIESYNDPGFSVFTLADEKAKDGVHISYFSFNDPGKESDYTNKLVDMLGENIVYNKDQSGDNTIPRLTFNYNLLRIDGGGFSESSLNAIYGIIAILILVIIFSSVSIIRNSFSISIVEKTRQFAILKSLGATDRQVKKNVLFEGFIQGLLGAIFGFIIGILATSILIIIVNKLLIIALNGIEFKLVLSFYTFIIPIIIGGLIVYLSSISIARRVMKLSPIEAIRSSNDIKIDPKKIKAPRYINKFFGIGGLIAYKNMKINKKKYRTTVLSLVVSISIFIGIFYLVDMTTKSIKLTFAPYIANYNISHVKYFGFNSDGGNKKQVEKDIEISKKLANNLLDGDKYAIYRSFIANSEKDIYSDEYLEALSSLTNMDKKELDPSLRILVLDDQYFQEILKENKLTDDSKFLIMNDLVGSENGKNKDLKPLKKLSIEISQNPSFLDEEGKNYNFSKKIELTEIDNPIVGFTKYQTIASDINIITSVSNLEESVYYDGSFLYIKAKDPYRTYEKLDKYLEDNNLAGYDLYNISRDLDIINNILLLLQIFGYGFIIIVTLIGITNIFNTITNNILLRKREFGALLSYGMSRKQLNRMNMLESIFLGTKSILFGVSIGILISIGTYLVLGYKVDINYSFPYIGVFISIIFVMLVVLLIMYYSISKISKQNIIDTIRDENL